MSSAAGRYLSSCDLRNLWLLRPTLESVSQEDLAVVGDALLLLRRSARTVDSGPLSTLSLARDIASSAGRNREAS